MAGNGISNERSRWHTNTRGHYPSYTSPSKIRARLAQGHGPMLSVQREVNKLFRVRSETGPAPRRATSAADVIHGLGVPYSDQQSIVRLLDGINVHWTPKTQTRRIALAQGQLTDTLRSMKHIPADTRQEIVKRALAYWRHTVQTDYGKPPTIRYKTDNPKTRASARRPNLTANQQKPRLLIPLTKAAPAPAPAQNPEAAGPKVDPTGHKYKARKPDGHGGWLYDYGDGKGYQPGKGEHEGHTVAPTKQENGQDKTTGKAPQHGGFKPTSEPHEKGGEEHHFHEDVSTHVKDGSTADDHLAQWHQHKAEADKLKDSKDDEDKQRMHAHVHAANLHEAKYREAKGAPDPDKDASHLEPIEDPIADPNGQAQPGQANPVGNAPPGAAQSSTQQIPGKNPDPAKQGLNGAEDPAQSSTQQVPGDPNADPNAEQAGDSAGFEAHHQSDSAKALHEHLDAASRAVNEMLVAHHHVQEMQQRIKTVQGDKEVSGSLNKRLAAQYKAELAAAEHQMAKLEHEHEQTIAQLRQAHGEMDDAHPAIGKLLEVFDKLFPGAKDKTAVPEAKLREPVGQPEPVPDNTPPAAAQHAQAAAQAPQQGARPGTPQPNDPAQPAKTANKPPLVTGRSGVTKSAIRTWAQLLGHAARVPSSQLVIHSPLVRPSLRKAVRPDVAFVVPVGA